MKKRKLIYGGSSKGSYSLEAELNILLDHYQNKQFNEVEKLARSIIQKHPNNPRSWQMLGVVLKEKGLVLDSLTAFQKVVELTPNDASAHSNLSHMLLKYGKLNEAVASSKTAIVIKPDLLEAYYHLGAALQALGRLGQAEIIYKKAISVNPDRPEAYSALGNVLHELRRFDEAETSYRKAIEIKPTYASAHGNLGVTLQELGRLKEAEMSYRRSISIKPTQAKVINNLGSLLNRLGRFEEAKGCYRDAIRINPEYTEAHYHLSQVERYQAEDEQIKQVAMLIGRQNLPQKDQVFLFFTAGKMQEEIGQTNLAFDYYSLGNRIHKALLQYDIKVDLALFNQIKSAFSTCSPLPLGTAHKGKTPVFIVGMPRSGTSLVEQILASHSMLYGAGELNLLKNAIDQTQILSDKSPENIDALRKSYLNELDNLKIFKPYISDKMPINFRWIGFILAAMPEAKIVHIKRHPLATIWSIFKINFTSNGNGFSYDLQDLVKFYQLYEDLMKFWHAKFPGQIYDIQYETLTKDQEFETRKLLKFVGLDWEDQCLTFHETKRAVATASAAQVRKPMYQGSSKEWERFKEYLLPIAGVLLDADSNLSKKLIPDAE
jgi:tetratricopeptide (TPR) repeat protein